MSFEKHENDDTHGLSILLLSSKFLNTTHTIKQESAWGLKAI